MIVSSGSSACQFSCIENLTNPWEGPGYSQFSEPFDPRVPTSASAVHSIVRAPNPIAETEGELPPTAPSGIQTVVEVWPQLLGAMRDAILAIIRASGRTDNC